MTHKISGETLIGFSDFFHDGIAHIGAAKTKGKPPKVFPYAKPRKTTAVQHHGKTLHHAHGVAAHAAQVIAHARQVLAAKPGTVPGKTVPLSGRKVHVGAATSLSPKAQAAVKKHNDAVEKARKATQVLAQKTLKAKASLQALAKKMVAQKKVAMSLRKPSRGGHGVHVGALLADPVIGEGVAQALRDYYDMVGADPDPNNPGFLTDGSPDPAAASAAADGTSAAADTQAGDAQDSGQLPPTLDMGEPITDLTQLGALMYHGEKGYPDGYAGSYNLFTRKTDSYAAIDSPGIDGTDHFGYVWGRFHDREQPGGLPFGDELKEGTWNHVRGRHWAAGANWANPVDPSEAFASATQSHQGQGYGPLVGNPQMADFKGLRIDSQGNMGWLPQEAPDWLTFPLKQAAALTAQQAAKAAKDAADAQAAADAKAQHDAQAAQAAQDAQNALSESQAKSEAAVAETQQQTQAQQALIEQQQADTAAQAVETEQTKQAGDILVQQAERAKAYYEQHPEEEFGPPVEPPGGEGEPPMPGTDGSGAEGTYDDGLPLPGGDITADADGEGYQDDGGGDEG